MRGPESGGSNYYPSVEIKKAENRELSWINDIISPDKLEIIKQCPAYINNSNEWLIMEALLSKEVEGGSEMDPHLKSRLGNLITAFRILCLPNLTPNEQSYIHDLANSGNFRNTPIKIDPVLKEDVSWIWNTFNLKKPSTSNFQKLQIDQKK